MTGVWIDENTQLQTQSFAVLSHHVDEVTGAEISAKWK